jgi:hypothetical protein
MPWPVEEPTAPNPPDGAIINYYLGKAAAGPVTLQIEDAQGRLVRRYSSTDAVTPIPQPANAPVPLYWYRTPQSLSPAAGMHRFIWDLHYQPLADAGAAGGRGGLPITAIPYNSAPAPGTPLVAPGIYRVTLGANGKTVSKSITVKQDPRVKTPPLTMRQVYALTDAIYFGAVDAQEAIARAAAWREQIEKSRGTPGGDVTNALTVFTRRLDTVVGAAAAPGGGRGGRGGGGVAAAAASQAAVSASATDTVQSVRTQLAGLMNVMPGADVAPTANTLAAIATARAASAKVMARWKALEATELPAVNAALTRAGAAPLR